MIHSRRHGAEKNARRSGLGGSFQRYCLAIFKQIGNDIARHAWSHEDDKTLLHPKKRRQYMSGLVSSLSRLRDCID